MKKISDIFISNVKLVARKFKSKSMLAVLGAFIEKQAEDPSPFRGGDECRTLFSHPIAIYPLGYI